MVQVDFNKTILGKLLDSKWLPSTIHGEAPRCVKCGSPLPFGRIRDKFLGGDGIRCPHCHSKSNWRSGTPFSCSTLDAGQAAALLLGLFLKLDTSIIAVWTGLSESSVRGWRRKFKELDMLLESPDEP